MACAGELRVVRSCRAGREWTLDINQVANYMRRHGLRLATAESCSAGLIAATLADIPGAGDLLEGAFVTYSPRAKHQWLGVTRDTLRHFNLTSEAVAREMALGALRRAHVNVSVANTGVTDGTDPEIPPGTQCFAWAFLVDRDHRSAPQVFSETRRFHGSRQQIRQASADYALCRLPWYAQQVERHSAHPGYRRSRESRDLDSGSRFGR